MSGSDAMPRCQATPSNLSGIGVENRRETSIWSSASTFTAKWPASSKVRSDGDFSDRLHSTSGGSSETELNEFAVRPTGSPPDRLVVMT